MTRSIRLAVVQMDAAPAPVPDRLAEAERAVAKCAQQGAQLVVLPEVFNTGYHYSDQNYQLAESLDGLTAGWMRETAARCDVYLAGSFLRRGHGRIWNTLLLVAPDGQTWHYDKNFPWVWERAYFEPGRGIAIADTDLGKIGFLICWDVAHTSLWQQYTGRVDLLVISSCPPKIMDATLFFPTGEPIHISRSGPFARYLQRSAAHTFGDCLRRQAQALGVPVAHATSTGVFTSSIPNPAASLTIFSGMVPQLLGRVRQWGGVQVQTGYFNDSYIFDPANGVNQAVPANRAGWAVQEVIVPVRRTHRPAQQPPFGLPVFPYLVDRIANLILAVQYRRKLQQIQPQGQPAATHP